MRVLKFFLFLLLLLWVQVKLPWQVGLIPLRVEWLFVACAYFGLVHGSLRGWWAGLGAGIFVDSFSLSPFGLNLILYSLIASLLGIFRRFLFLQSFPTRLALMLLASVLLEMSRYLYFSWAAREELPWLAIAWETTLPLIVWNTASSIALMWLMGLLQLATPKREDRETFSADMFSGLRRRLARKST